jgi:uncharacterized protein with HEPN domain
VSRDWLLYLEDMTTATAKILRFTRGMSFEDFSTDELVYDAVLHNLLGLGIVPACARSLAVTDSGG